MEDFLTSATLWSRFVTGYLEEGATADKEGTDGGDEKEVREQDESGEIKIKRNGIEGTTSKIVAKVEKRKKGRKKYIYIYVGEKKKKKVLRSLKSTTRFQFNRSGVRARIGWYTTLRYTYTAVYVYGNTGAVSLDRSSVPFDPSYYYYYCYYYYRHYYSSTALMFHRIRIE